MRPSRERCLSKTSRHIVNLLHASKEFPHTCKFQTMLVLKWEKPGMRSSLGALCLHFVLWIYICIEGGFRRIIEFVFFSKAILRASRSCSFNFLSAHVSWDSIFWWFRNNLLPWLSKSIHCARPCYYAWIVGQKDILCFSMLKFLDKIKNVEMFLKLQQTARAVPHRALHCWQVRCQYCSWNRALTLSLLLSSTPSSTHIQNCPLISEEREEAFLSNDSSPSLGILTLSLPI